MLREMEHFVILTGLSLLVDLCFVVVIKAVILTSVSPVV